MQSVALEKAFPMMCLDLSFVTGQISLLDNVPSQQFYGGLAVSLSLLLATAQLQHCCNIVQTYSSLSHTQLSPNSSPPTSAFPEMHDRQTHSSPNFSSSPDALGELKESVADSSGVMLKKLCLSECSEEVLVCLDGLSISLPAVRVWLQWLVHQRELWEQWLGLVDKSAM